MGYILFSSDEVLSIVARHIWDGIIEYSYDNKKWNVWNGNQIINTKIYMRGINNTAVSCGDRWIINGKNVKCQGNIENLLDYKSVINNIHPKMKRWCYASLFHKCSCLIEAPQLLAVDLVPYCYYDMFGDCSSLIMPPMLQAQNLALECCSDMFVNCISLTNAPQLSASKLAYKCYAYMFEGCTRLQTVPTLKSTQLAEECYCCMFLDCTSIKNIPYFPTLAVAKETIINQKMFYNCFIPTININNKLYDINVLKLL